MRRIKIYRLFKLSERPVYISVVVASIAKTLNRKQNQMFLN